jgi:hypothetical protein
VAAEEDTGADADTVAEAAATVVEDAEEDTAAAEAADATNTRKLDGSR